MAFQATHDRNAAGSRPAAIERLFVLDVHSMDGRKLKPAILTKTASIPGNSHTGSKMMTSFLLRRFTLVLDHIDVDGDVFDGPLAVGHPHLIHVTSRIAAVGSIVFRHA